MNRSKTDGVFPAREASRTLWQSIVHLPLIAVYAHPASILHEQHLVHEIVRVDGLVGCRDQWRQRFLMLGM